MSGEPGLLARGVRFGLVGLSGVIVNQVVLWVSEERLFRTLEPASLRLDCSLGLAIGLATLNNYYWNQRWTWRDRVEAHTVVAVFARFLRYLSASLAAIVLQVVFTKGLVASGWAYAVANLVAVGLAAGLNFVLNHTVTFARRRAAGEPA